jgi:multidrug transporter EmrE-like cation transporter
MDLLAYSILITSIIFGVFGQLLLKYGMSKRPLLRFADIGMQITNLPVVFGFASYGISVIFYFNALARLDLSLAYPTVSLGYIAVVVFSKIFLKENFSAWRWLALVLICCGVVLVGIG